MTSLATRLKPGTLPVTLLALVVIALAIFARPAPPPKTDATWARIQQEGILRVGLDPSFPPFESDDGSGNLSGLDIALVQAMAQRWNIQVKFVYSGFDGLYDSLQAGQFDLIISALPYDPTKTEDVNFSHSYFNGGPVIVVRADDPRAASLYDLAGQRVAVELGSRGDSVARHWQRRLRLDVRALDTPLDALRAVKDSQVSAALVDPIAFFDFAKTETGLKSVGKNLADELYVIAVRKDSPILLEQINAAIDAMKVDGTLEGMKKRWF
jgi:ABC-type amino acid transport substrate-binding protein